MARKPRFLLPGVPQHVVQRGHNREPCFYSEQDYIRYLANLGEAAERNQVNLTPVCRFGCFLSIYPTAFPEISTDFWACS